LVETDATEHQVPPNFDWRDRGAVRSVKNQDQCGGCWAFAAAAMLESANFLKYNISADLSPQHFIDCVAGDNCTGGLSEDCLAYAITNGGVAFWDHYPVVLQTGIPDANTCRVPPPASRTSASVIVNRAQHMIANTVQLVNPAFPSPTTVEYLTATPSSWIYVPSTDAGLLAEVMKQPITVSINVCDDFGMYSSGIYSNHTCPNGVNDTTHTVTLIGWGRRRRRDRRWRKYWIVKNSWGTDWGIDGYFKIKRPFLRDGMAGINTDGVAVVLA